MQAQTETMNPPTSGYCEACAILLENQTAGLIECPICHGPVSVRPDLVSDVCKCLHFRNEHAGGSGDAMRRNGACEAFTFLRRCNAELDLERWVDAIVIGKRKR
jgi:hypothetical protein